MMAIRCGILAVGIFYPHSQPSVAPLQAGQRPRAVSVQQAVYRVVPFFHPPPSHWCGYRPNDGLPPSFAVTFWAVTF